MREFQAASLCEIMCWRGLPVVPIKNPRQGEFKRNGLRDKVLRHMPAGGVWSATGPSQAGCHFAPEDPIPPAVSFVLSCTGSQGCRQPHSNLGRYSQGPEDHLGYGAIFSWRY